MLRTFWCALLLVGLAPVLAADAPKATLETQPATVAVPPQGATNVLVVFRNPSGERLSDVRLSWLTPEGVKAAAETVALPDVGPYEEVSGTLRFSRDPAKPFPGEGTVSLQAAYNWLQKDRQKVKRVPRIALASFKVALQQPDKIDQVASVDVKSAAKVLVEGRPAGLYLVVANTSNEPLEVVRVDPDAPRFVSVSGRKVTFPKLLGPRDTLVIPYELTAGQEEPIKPGRHLILFKVALKWRTGGRELSGLLLAAHEMDIGILGESEILTLLGVPTFLVLPGFLIVVTFTFLWNRTRNPDGSERKEKLLEKMSPEFWLAAVSLSIITAALYPTITDLLGSRRSYLDGYVLADIVRIWTGCVFLGGLAFLGVRTWEKKIYEKRQGLVFVEGDLPLEVLKKLSRQQAGLSLPGVVVALDDEELPLFLLQSSGNRLWVAPPILLNGLDTVEDGLKGQILAQLYDDGDPGQLADLLERAPQISPAWRSGDSRRYPISVERSAQRGALSPKTVLARDPENEVA